MPTAVIDKIEHEIEHIKDILPHLSETSLHELKSFADYLANRERRRRALEERVLKAEKEPPIRFKTVDEAVKAVFDETGD